MSSSTAALSQTLKTITLTKFKEIEKQRKTYELSKTALLEAADKLDANDYERIQCLLRGFLDILPDSDGPIDVKNIDRWLEQSRFDSSIPAHMLRSFEVQLRSQLQMHTRKLDLAALYSNLLTEWLNTTKGPETSTQDSKDLDGSSDEIAQDRLKTLTTQFESIAFSPSEINEKEVHEYLGEFFKGEIDKKVLTSLRNGVINTCEGILETKSPFNEKTIQWCLKGLLANDLLRDDKKAILQEFLSDEVARKEICDVLNMKFIDFNGWEWNCEEKGLPVEPRPQLNGKYRIMMDEDILDAIFLHYIGTLWAVYIRISMCGNVQTGDRVKNKAKAKISNAQTERRKYFLGPDIVAHEQSDNVDILRQEMFEDDFFMSQLPSTVHGASGGYDDDGENEDAGDDEISNPWAAFTRQKVKKTPKEVKQQLLRLLATEVQVHKALHGRVVVVQSDFKWFGTSIPHSTIFAVLRFMGVEENWITFFRKFLEAPLDMSPSSGDESSAKQGRIRKRGVPMAHALEKFFGEAVLFFLDIAVKHEAQMPLYRFHDDLWLVGQPENCATAWEEMERFAEVMGLELNNKKTGSVFLTQGEMSSADSAIAAWLPEGPVTVGFLTLDPKTGDWEIDQKQVDAHVKQLSKQLANSTSILSWVQIWNSCIGRFFSHTFGEPANCFGRKHVDAILHTYKNMQETLFPGSNACQYLKGLIEKRFGIKDIPDAFIFLPEALGGLGVRNPFVKPFILREEVAESPAKILEEFFEQSEQVKYDAAKKLFEDMNVQDKKRRLMLVYTDAYGDVSLPAKDQESLNTFMSKAEYTQNRTSTSQALKTTYQKLMAVPSMPHTESSVRVHAAMQVLELAQPGMERQEKIALKAEMSWILQTYEQELMETCGSMSIVEKNLLPLGILTILRRKKVAWQMVL